MKLTLPVFLTAFAVTTFALNAQTQTTSREVMEGAIAFRAKLAIAVAKDAEKPAVALQQIADRPVASGLSSLGRDADYAYASLDVAYRLMALERPDAAEIFFQAAEQGFEKAVQRDSRGQAKIKAQYLKKLGMVQAKHLNKPEQARANLAEAARLQPKDRSLAKLNEHLARRSEGFTKGNSKN